VSKPAGGAGIGTLALLFGLDRLEEQPCVLTPQAAAALSNTAAIQQVLMLHSAR
jgi:hypothetical protein